MTAKKKEDTKQQTDAADFLDLWEKNLALIATRGLEFSKKVEKD